MKTFKQSLLRGFAAILDGIDGDTKVAILKGTMKEEYIKHPSYYSFLFGENKEYELCFERLLFDNQWYVALYKNKDLLTEKVVIKPGYTGVKNDY